MQMNRDSLGDNERLRRECDELKSLMGSKIASIDKEFVKISKHEEILNSELQNA